MNPPWTGMRVDRERGEPVVWSRGLATPRRRGCPQRPEGLSTRVTEDEEGRVSAGPRLDPSTSKYELAEVKMRTLA